MSLKRPDPDDLLARVQADAARVGKGSLKIFFGYAAGVGKTYAMLEAARRAKASGRDVVVGYVEPHGRPETEVLLRDLEALATRQVDYRGMNLREFDVDNALARKSELLLVDELAHTNAEGSRHAKRWQDVEELLEAGISVWTTLNVQHIESLNDVLGQITGVIVRETVPDKIFDLADELELVDISPEDLLVRLQAGNVYVHEQAERALRSFFQKSNLVALRELALRSAAQRVHADVETARRTKAVPYPWATAERLLVCVGPSPTTARVIRTAKRMAAALEAPWLAVAVERSEIGDSSQANEQFAQNFRLAEKLGAETVTLCGQDVAGTILEYARSRNVTKILIGKTRQSRWRRFAFGSFVDSIIDNSGEIDVYVIQGREDSKGTTAIRAARTHVSWWPHVYALTTIVVCGLIAAALAQLELAEAPANAVMIFLAGVAFVAYQCGRSSAILASILAVLVFDFFFVPPQLTFAVSDTQYVVTFVVMLTIGLLISTLTSRLKLQVESTAQRERRSAALFQLGKQLSSLSGELFLVSAAGKQVSELFGGEVAVYLKRPNDSVSVAWGFETSIAKDALSSAVAQWVCEHDKLAGAGTDTLPNARALFVPLTASQQTLGALAVRVAEIERILAPDQRRLIEACANQLALALERDQMAIEAAESRIRFEAEQVRSSLLSSVSHDLKTPLAAIAGAGSSLLHLDFDDHEIRRQLLATITAEADRLNRLLENILQMSKLDAGATPPNKQWHVLEEIVGSALHRTSRELQSHRVEMRLPASLPLIHVDGLLLEQVFVNLFENAAKYTPVGSQLTVTACIDGRWLRIAVIDNGPGLTVGEEERIFEKFYRASPVADTGRGSGLGLAICRAIIDSHGGNITAANRPNGGAEFILRLPLPKDSPQITVDEH